jgi:hypothetical protein
MDANSPAAFPTAPTARAKRSYRAPGQLPKPPEGVEAWTKEQCAAHFNVGKGKWAAWEREGKVTIARYRAANQAGAPIMYLRRDVEMLGFERAVPFAPAGVPVMTRIECAEHFGVSEDTFCGWENSGRVPIPRFKVKGPHRPLVVYLASDVATLPFPAPLPLPPAGAAVMTRDECAAHFGVTENTFMHWETGGLVPIPRYRYTAPHARVCYLASDVATLNVETPPPLAPAGLEVMTREQCAEYWGLGIEAWSDRERQGLVNIPRYSMIDNRTRKHCYAAAEVKDLPFEAPLPLPAPGVEMWTRDDCADYFGITEDAWNDREVKGEVPLQRYRWTGNSPHKCCYIAAEVAGLGGRVLPPPPPEGLAVMDRAECAAFFGIALDTWGQWEQQGKVTITRYRRAMRDGTRRMCYSVKDLTQLREAFRAEYAPFPDPERPGCYRIPIYTCSGKRFAVIDGADLPKVEGKSWNVSERSDEDSPRGTVVLAAEPHTQLKRIITGTTGGDHTMRISHRNGDYLDCTRANLNARSMAEQTYGTRKMRTWHGRPVTSKYKGVSWVEPRGKWTAHINKDRKAYYLGLFIEEEDAARTYDEAARRMFGQHARLNFPDEEALLMHRDTADRSAA